MFISTPSNPASDYGPKSKNQPNSLKHFFNFITLFGKNSKSCQSCFDYFYTKTSSQLSQNLINKAKFFPKNNNDQPPQASFSKPKNLNIIVKNNANSISHYHDWKVLYFIKYHPKVIKLFEFNKLALSGDIQLNPGPNAQSIITLNTYNARGLKSKLKLKRVLIPATKW